MHYVYILKSLRNPLQKYIGFTSDLKKRLADHNCSRCAHTSKFMPWKIDTYIAFSDKGKAIEFERYLKTGSGWAFLGKRF